jgi:hypothetical protein
MLYILKLDLTKWNRIVPEATLLKMQNFLTIFDRAWYKPIGTIIAHKYSLLQGHTWCRQ